MLDLSRIGLRLLIEREHFRGISIPAQDVAIINYIVSVRGGADPINVAARLILAELRGVQS